MKALLLHYIRHPTEKGCCHVSVSPKKIDSFHRCIILLLIGMADLISKDLISRYLLSSGEETSR